MSLVLSSGCSLVWGSELEDCRHHGEGGYSKCTWPALIAKEIGADYYCVARAGASNDVIARNVIEYCETHDCPDLVIVQWTYPERFTYKFGYPINGSQWHTFNLWSVSEEHAPVDKVMEKDDPLYGFSERRRKLAKEVGVSEFIDVFFKHVAYIEYWPLYTTYKEIVGLQNYLKLNNVPYIFTCADNCIFTSASLEEDKHIIALVNQLDKDRWVMFPPGDKPHHTQAPRGFYQWAEENKYKKAIGGHHLEQAHDDASKLIKDKINEMVKKHLEQNCSGNSLP